MLERMWGEKRFYSLVEVVCKLARQLWRSIGRMPPAQLKLEFPCDPATPLLGTCTDDGTYPIVKTSLIRVPCWPCQNTQERESAKTSINTRLDG